MSQLQQLVLIGDSADSGARLPALWWQTLILFLLVAWLYASILAHLVAQWTEDPNFSHGFLVPVFAMFVLWRGRSHLAALPRRPNLWGMPIIAGSLTVLVVGVMGAELFLARVSLLVLLAGLVLVFLGTNYFRAVVFPWACLFLMIPIPSILFNQLTLPLQILASRMAAAVLPWLGVPVLREGNIINLAAMSLEVAEACSGIRSLLSLITLAVVYGYLASNVKWVRMALVLAAVPIAVLANSLRIVVTGLLVQYWSPAAANGFFHSFSSWLLFLVSLAMLFLARSLFNLIHSRSRRAHD